MKTHEITTYSFEELSDKAKEAARDEYRIHNLDYKWWDSVYDDAWCIGYRMGINITDMWFSGFCSQGNGACFTGRYTFKKGAIKSIKDYAPNDTDLHDIVTKLFKIARRCKYSVSVKIETSGRYSHSGTMGISNDYISDVDYIVMEEALRDTIRLFADWIYTQLEKEYDYLNSNEVVDKSLINNEYDFLENGEVY